VARPQERRFLGFSFTTGPDIRRMIAPKSLERFKQRIREITRRAKGVGIKTTMEELAPYMRGWRGYCKTSRGKTNQRIPIAEIQSAHPGRGCFRRNYRLTND
jgi:hypothetical protein